MDRCRALRASGALMIVAGVALMAYAALQGDVSFALVLIVPVIYGSGPLAALSALMVFAGVVLLSLSFFMAAAPPGAAFAPEGARRGWGGVILIGPVPIVIGSAGALRSRWALVLLAALSVLMLALFLLTYLR